jgi:hypothetical protein
MKIQNFPERDRLCVLYMDELSQKANLFYKVGQDKIVGIVSATFCAGCVQAVQSSTVLLIKGIFQNEANHLYINFHILLVLVKYGKCLSRELS